MENPKSSTTGDLIAVRGVRQAVRDTLRDAKTRLTPLDIERTLSRSCRINRKKVRLAIKELVDRQELMYVSDFGRTFVETSLHKPIRITSNVVLKPWNCSFKQDPGDVVVSLCHGISFGSGQHPTTRLCLKGLGFLQQSAGISWRGQNTRAIDIGTGSGVLIITALKMGVASGVGIDIDACARSEAVRNVACNGLSERISILSEPFETFKESFNLILANLRLPTLEPLLPLLADRITPGGRILLSGIKNEEIDLFLEHSRGSGLCREWVGNEQGWAAIVFFKHNHKKGVRF